MESVIDTIEEIKSRLEREVEWPITDYVAKDTVSGPLAVIYENLQMLQTIAETVAEGDSEDV